MGDMKLNGISKRAVQRMVSLFFVIVWYNPAITKREVYAAATTD